jgi:hypothetical protein
MSLLRRWFDPIRSKWYFQQPHAQADLPIDQGISVYLRLDDVYSYLAVQLLEQLEEILVDGLKPLQIVLCTEAAAAPNGMSQNCWQQYALNDAKNLAKQHRFAYDDVPELPSAQALDHAHHILQRTQLQGRDFLYLLENLFHMLWQQQYGKLNMLYQMCKTQPVHSQQTQFRYASQAILSAQFAFGGRQYHAVDDLLRLTRRLQQQKLLTAAPIFLINHVEWGEHLINDAEDLSLIQALQPELDLYLALEDPISWLLLAYIQDELAKLYNIQLKLYPLPYQQRDQFDWSLATRLSKRAGIEFSPFCRPDALTVQHLARAFYQVDASSQVAVLLEMLRQTWTRGKDLSRKSERQQLLKGFELGPALSAAQIAAQLQANAERCAAYQQPDLPVMQLRIAGQSFVFNSLYRVWMIETIFSQVLEQLAKAQYQEHQDDQS